MKFLNNNRVQVALVLLILWLFRLFYKWDEASFWQVMIALSSSIVFDLGLSYVRGKVWFFSASTLVTGLLIGLIMDVRIGLWGIILTSLLSSLTKQLLGSGNHRHIFNPAALGVVGISLIFNSQPTWWGASWDTMPLLILGFGMVPILFKLKRLWQALIFLSAYFIMQWFWVGIDSAWRLTLDGTVFLFALVMLTEPITSLNVGKWKYLWGLLVMLFLIIENLLRASFADPLLLALLFSNAIGYVWKRRLNPHAVAFNEDASVS